MTKLRIVSNPYRDKKRTRFQSYDGEQWMDVSSSQNTNSDLLRDEITETFFPFAIENILSIISKEYCGDMLTDPINIEFAGTDEDYAALESICQQRQSSPPIILSRSDEYLPNARDILPLIIDDFRDLRDIFDIYARRADPDSFQLYNDLVAKFEDASTETIPICVIGNYSAGKSTFINALIGHELLPSGDEPTTARIYKLSRSMEEDCAYLEFDYGKTPVVLSLKGVQYSFEPSSMTSPLVTELSALLDNMKAESVVHKLSHVLDRINQCSCDELSDLIRITVPFSSAGLFGKTQRKFLIIDTPGSNYASDENHQKRLWDAMEGLSNGLPIIACENSTKASLDFADLYQTAANMPNLDHRFTILLINKADAANLSKTMCAPSPSIKRSGVYFLSSIMGLGFKTQGVFSDPHIEEVFESNREKYINPQNHYYHQLYTHNILPPQIKRDYDAIAAQASDSQSLLYANSGLQHVELAIEHFADFYAPYNKCSRCHTLLQDMIQESLKKIDSFQAEKEHILAQTQSEFEEMKNALSVKLDRCKIARTSVSQAKLSKILLCAGHNFLNKGQTDKQHWKSQEYAFRKEKSIEHNIESHQARYHDAGENLVQNLRDGFHSFDPKHLFGCVNDIGRTLADDLQSWGDNMEALVSANRSVQSEAQRTLVQFAKTCFNQDINKYKEVIITSSTEFLEGEDQSLRSAFQEIIENSSALSEENREVLREVVEKFSPSDYSVEATFQADKYLPHFLKEIRPMKHQKMASEYNRCLDEAIDSMNTELAGYLSPIFDAWATGLVKKLKDCLSTFNPDLHEIADKLDELQLEIENYQAHTDELKQHSDKIENLMAWRKC